MELVFEIPLLSEKILTDADVVKHLPSWLPFQKEAQKGREMIERLVSKPFEHVKREMVRQGTRQE